MSLKTKDSTGEVWALLRRNDLYELAGALSVPFMRDNPEYEMPSEELIEIVDWYLGKLREVNADFGL